jgi:hypothetical protein
VAHEPTNYVPYDPDMPTPEPRGDVAPYPTRAQFPAVGKRNTLYVEQEEPHGIYVWTGIQYVMVGSGGGSGGGGGSGVRWDDIPEKPKVVAAGDTPGAAREVIGAVSSTQVDNKVSAALSTVPSISRTILADGKHVKVFVDKNGNAYLGVREDGTSDLRPSAYRQ